MQFLNPTAAPNCLHVPSAGAERGALFLVQGLGRFISAQGCFKVLEKMSRELERCGGGMFVLVMLILVLLTPSCGSVSLHRAACPAGNGLLICTGGGEQMGGMSNHKCWCIMILEV